MTVVLPEPVGPTKATCSPGAMRKLVLKDRLIRAIGKYTFKNHFPRVEDHLQGPGHAIRGSRGDIGGVLDASKLLSSSPIRSQRSAPGSRVKRSAIWRRGSNRRWE